MPATFLDVIDGGGELIATLEKVLARVRSGHIEGLAFIALAPDNEDGLRGYSYKADMPFAISRLRCGVADLGERLRQEAEAS